MQRRAAAHELHRLEQLAERPAGDHDGQRLVAVHDAVAEIRQQASGRHDTGGGDAHAVGQRRGRSHPARVGCARATRRRVAPRRPRCAGPLAASASSCAAAGLDDRGRRARPAARSRLGSRAPRPPTLARDGGAGRGGGRARPLPGRRVLARPAGDGAARRPRARAARGGCGGRRRARARLSGRGALRRRAHARHRHALALERSRAAAARRRAARARSARGDRRAARLEARGLARRAAAPPARQRSQLVARPLRRAASASTATARPASCSRPTAIRTTARRRRPTQRAGRAWCASSTELGLEVGLHASYTCLADERLLRERAGRAGASARRADRGQPPSLPAAALARRHPRARPPRLRLRLDARLGGAAGAARRPLVPVPALGRRRRGARCASSSCRSC